MAWDMPANLRTVPVLKTIKLGLSLEKICTDCPSEFLDILRYARSLKYAELPDYDYLSTILRNLSVKICSENSASSYTSLICISTQHETFLSSESKEETSPYLDTEEEDFSGVITEEFRFKLKERRQQMICNA